MKFKVEWKIKGPGGETWAPNKTDVEAKNLTDALVKSVVTVTEYNEENGGPGQLQIIGMKVEPR